MSDEISLVVHLMLALTVLVGVCAAAVAIGWLRWGHRHTKSIRHSGDGEVPRLVMPGLFSAVGAPPSRDQRQRLQVHGPGSDPRGAMGDQARRRPSGNVDRRRS